MGITGLLPLLKSIHRPTELKKFAGETLAVDAYGWLHRGAVGCALELAQGKKTRKYVDFAMHRVRMVKHFGATPYLVFDGDYLPSKALTEASREKRREESRKAGMELLKAGKAAQAYLEFQKAIDITPEMARQLIEELKKIGVPYVVAPYEADAQMVWLEKHGFVDGIITEDSDLLVFGAKRLITKLDKYGQCVEVNRREFCAVREISLAGWTDDLFRQMAILSGCDYLEGIPNMGLKTAYRQLRKHKTPEKVIRMLQFEGKHRISENYLPKFKQAELTFKHQRVYDHEKGELALLDNDLKGLDVEEMPFIGAKMDPELARGIASGDINPITKEPIIIELTPERRQVGSAYPTRAAPVPNKPLGKPIKEYFKDKRIPMGEMDRNCFAVDPQQVAALTQNGLTPRVFPLPRPYLPGAGEPNRRHSAPAHTFRRRAEPIADLLGMAPPPPPDANRRRTVNPMTRSSDDANLGLPASSTRPPKKARLCVDADDTTQMPSSSDHQDMDALPVVIQTSKFFPTAVSRTTRSSARHSLMAMPMSDDSLDEALLDLPDFGSLSSTKPSKPRKSLVFEDSPRKENVEVANTPEKPHRGEVMARRAFEDDTVEVPVSSPLRAEIVSFEEEVSTTQQKQHRRRSSLRSSIGSFSYKPSLANSTTAAGTKMAFGLPTPASSAASSVTGSRRSSSLHKRESSSSSFSDVPMPTPLQRIGANAVGANAIRRSGSVRAVSSPMTNSPARTTEPALGETKSSSRGNRRSSARRSLPPPPPVNPAFVPLPKADRAEVEALSRPPLRGSEDLIVPDSDCENEPESPHSKAYYNGGRAGIDLSRFVYG